mmetsp:Transcript_1072/g.2728  ORF Transcript_1072/g.2728 Transcript_1072/m.2728 type:complete len:214 (+) Transcript_1072:1363-2004(+)
MSPIRLRLRASQLSALSEPRLMRSSSSSSSENSSASSPMSRMSSEASRRSLVDAVWPADEEACGVTGCVCFRTSHSLATRSRRSLFMSDSGTRDRMGSPPARVCLNLPKSRKVGGRNGEVSMGWSWGCLPSSAWAMCCSRCLTACSLKRSRSRWRRARLGGRRTALANAGPDFSYKFSPSTLMSCSRRASSRASLSPGFGLSMRLSERSETLA